MKNCLFISMKRTEINILHILKSQWDFRWTLEHQAAAAEALAAQSHFLGISAASFLWCLCISKAFSIFFMSQHIQKNPWISTYSKKRRSLKAWRWLRNSCCELCTGNSPVVHISHPGSLYDLDRGQCTSRVLAFLGAS